MEEEEAEEAEEGVMMGEELGLERGVRTGMETGMTGEEEEGVWVLAGATVEELLLLAFSIVYVYIGIYKGAYHSVQWVTVVVSRGRVML